ncbi:MAG: hypothetical protein QOF44_1015 [Streptomyces sp.]|nr:hypothetical protein [Streptomyces sp.]
MRLKLAALACASTAATLVIGLAPAASAASIAPTLLEAGSVQDDNGVLAVSAASDSAIKQITAHFFPRWGDDTTTEAGVTQDFTLHSGTADNGVWYTTQPVQLAQLGDYRTVIELTDADGDHTEAADGSLDYNSAAVFDAFTVTPAKPDWFHQDVTVSGRLVRRDPGTRERVPMDGVPVHLLGVDDSGAATTATTDADGRFTQVFAPQRDGSVSAYYNSWEGSPYAVGTTTGTPVRVTLAQSETRVTLDAKDVGIKPGQTAKIGGKAEVRNGDGAWKPLSGQTVTLDPQGQDGDPSATATTGADGRFTGSLTPQSTKAVNVTVGTDYAGFLALSPVQVARIHVAATTAITGFHASLDKNSQLTVGGTLNTGDRQPDSANADIEYSKDGRTGWTLVKSLTTGVDAAPGDFNGTFDARSQGYWRAHYKGTPDFAASTSDVLYVKRTATRVKGANASPEPVKKGRTITVTGALQQNTSGATWKAYASQKVTILFRPKGSTTWSALGTVTTKADGSFSKGFTAKKDGTWMPALLSPDSKHLASSGAEDYVDVR